MTDIRLTKVSESANTLVLGHDPVPGAIGFRLSPVVKDGVVQAGKWAHTWDGSRTEHRFAPGHPPYRVEALGSLAAGTWGEHWDLSFATRDESPSVLIDGATDVEISGKTFRGYTGNDPVRPFAIHLKNCVNVRLVDLDFDAAVKGIKLQGCSGTLEVGWVRYRDFVGPHANLIQLDHCVHSGGRIHDMKGIGGLTEDVVSVYMSGGTGPDDPLVIEDCAFEGTNWEPTSRGSAVMLGDQGGSHTICRRVTALNPGSNGFGIAGGTDHHITDCVAYGEQWPGTQTGMVVWNQSGQPSSGHEVSRNKVHWIRQDGVPSPRWDAGNSGPILGWTTGGDTNLWGVKAGLDPELLRVQL